MQDKISLAHGNGGKLMEELLDEIIVKILNRESTSVQMDDSAILKIPEENLAFTTDSYTISPIFFKGGDIGKLSVFGTVNDLAVMGAEPKYISCGFIIEEGFKISELKKILFSMQEAAKQAGVFIVTGDTKVVEKNKADKIFINTSGIGIVKDKIARKPIKNGDQILINGTIGDHGISIMAQRNDLSANQGLESDCAPLNRLLNPLTKVYYNSIKFIRDATRGGVVSVLNEVVKGQNFSIKLYEENLPFKKEVLGVCELLGIDPLYAANEGKVVMIVKKDQATAILNEIKKNDLGREAAIIGEVTEEFIKKVYLQTSLGGTRVLPLEIESQLPRIC